MSQSPSINATYEFKIALLGDANVGKTAITHRFVNGTYSENVEPNQEGLL